MSEFEFEVLDIENKEKVVMYEKTLYKAFKNTEIKTLDKIWVFDYENKRLKTVIPYESQKICLAYKGDNLVAGSAININVDEPFQLEMLGFTINKKAGVAEGLGVFNFPELSGYKPLAIIIKDFSLNIIKNLGIKKMYGTCSEKKLRGYKILGWEPIDERYFMGEKKYLLHIPIK